jgi:hypothetical protein
MLDPIDPHLVQGRAVEIRQSDGGKPSDSFIIKKNETKEEERRHRDRDRDQDRD